MEDLVSAAPVDREDSHEAQRSATTQARYRRTWEEIRRAYESDIRRQREDFTKLSDAFLSDLESSQAAVHAQIDTRQRAKDEAARVQQLVRDAVQLFDGLSDVQEGQYTSALTDLLDAVREEQEAAQRKVEDATAYL